MKRISILFGVILAISSCKKDDDIVVVKTPLDVPTTYSSVNFATNAAPAIGITTQLLSLTTYMKNGESVANKLSKDSLNFYFSGNGTPSLKSVTGTYFSNLVENTWFDELVASSQNSYDPANGSTASVGGVFVNRLLNAKAKENIQEIDKGLYLAALFNHLVSLSNGAISDATIDNMLAAIGGNPSFPNSYSSNVASPDTDVLKYVSRRDKNDGTGFYSKIKNGFLKLKAALAAGDDYQTEQNDAITQIRNNVEKGMIATNINYCYAAISKLSATNLTDADKAGALHDLGEAVGFVHGLKAVPANARIITDAQVDDVLADLMAPSTGKGQMYMFVNMPATHLAQLTSAQNKLKDIYNFSATQMEDFKNNWVSVQGR